MATLYVTEFAALLPYSGVGAAAQVALQSPTAEQTVTIASSISTSSSAFNKTTSLVRLHTDAICSVIFGTAPTATSGKARLAANQTEYFVVPQGQSYKVAVITNT